MAFSSLTWRIKERDYQLILVSQDSFLSLCLWNVWGTFSLNCWTDLTCQPFIDYVYLISTDLTFFISYLLVGLLVFTANILNSQLVLSFMELVWTVFYSCPKKKSPQL